MSTGESHTPMRILALYEGGTGCDLDYYRIFNPFRALTKAYPEEFEVDYLSQVSTPPDASKTHPLSSYDAITIQRLTRYDALPMWRRTRTPNNRLVYENDDDVFHVTPDNFMAYKYYQSNSVKEAVRALCETTDMVTVTSQPLFESFSEFSNNVRIVPNFLSDVALHGAENKPFNKPNNLTIGWAGGGSHSKDIQLVTGPLQKFLRRHKDWHLVNAGEDMRSYWKLTLDRVQYRPWISVLEDEEAYFRSLDFTIGICPLLGSAFNSAKTPVKAMEYAARGIPTIASDVEPYKSYIRHGETGFLVKYEHEWLKYFELLAEDEKLRQDIARNAYEVAEQHSMTKNVYRYKDAYRSMFEGRI
jgi:glycosyltransferase involved in cell wall biosynthesis